MAGSSVLRRSPLRGPVSTSFFTPPLSNSTPPNCFGLAVASFTSVSETESDHGFSPSYQPAFVQATRPSTPVPPHTADRYFFTKLTAFSNSSLLVKGTSDSVPSSRLIRTSSLQSRHFTVLSVSQVSGAGRGALTEATQP